VGWLDWVYETARKIGISIETGLRGIIGLPEEIEPYIPSRPATAEQIEEIMEALPYTERFIREALPDEARRLARGVSFYRKLRNVAQTRHWTTQAPEDIIPDEHTQITLRRVLIGPDGTMTHVDVAFGYGELYDEDEALRRTAAALDNEFVDRYQIGRSQLVREYVVIQEVYLQRHKPLS
jgi:hypothetical protein